MKFYVCSPLAFSKPELDTLEGLSLLGHIPLVKCVKTDADGQDHAFPTERGKWTVCVAGQGDVYRIFLSRDYEVYAHSTRIREYSVFYVEDPGVWLLRFKTRSGATYRVNIGYNAAFDKARSAENACPEPCHEDDF